MTELLYQTDAYLKEFNAKITAVDLENRVLVLDQSAFYPGGGGQPCDFGVLTVSGVDFPVSKVKKQGEDVLHFIGGEVALPAPLQTDAHTHCLAHPVWDSLSRLWRAGHRWGYGTARRADGF
jgi:Ser-tRNA(Ala) deacylase AlaX